MRSQKRSDFLKQNRVARALLAQEFLLLLGRHLQRCLQQFIHSFPAFSIHQNFHHLSRRSILEAASQEER